LIRTVDPAAASLPIYIVGKGAARRAGILEAGDFAGLTSIGMSGDLRRLLEGQGRWRGRGFATIVDVAGITTTAALQGIILHEYAHHCEAAAATAQCADAMGLAAYDAALSEPRKDLGVERPAPPRDEIKEMHGPRFLRLAIHAELRAVWRCAPGVRIVVDPPAYGWPEWWKWRAGLGDEPARLLHLPMVEVAAMEPPESYTQFVASISPAA